MRMIEVHIGEAASYTAAGVDIDAGDEISNMWFNATVATYDNRFDRVGHLAMRASKFSSVRGFDMDLIQGQSGLRLFGAVDGVGTKPEIAKQLHELKNIVNVQEKFRDHTGIPRDVAAMCVDDLARDGIEPFGLFMLYDTNKLSSDDAKEVTRQLTDGAVIASRLGDVVFMGGESAELSELVGGYGPFNYNLGGFALGMGHKDRILTGEKVKPGDRIVSIRAKESADDGPGFRSNGFSLVRKVLQAEYGQDWHEALKDDPEFVNAILRPSTIFAPMMVDMNGGYDKSRTPKVERIHGFVHVTGGGIVGKLQRILAIGGYGAVIERPLSPIYAMKRVQEISLKHADKKLDTDDASAYQSLNMGNELLYIGPDSERAMEVAEEHGKDAQEIGEVVSLPGIELVSEGVTHPGERIRFIPKAA